MPTPSTKFVASKNMGLDFAAVTHWQVFKTKEFDIKAVKILMRCGSEIFINHLSQEEFTYLVVGLENYFYGCIQPELSTSEAT